MENKIKAALLCSSCCVNDVNDDVQKVLRHSNKKQHHLHLNLSTWLKSELPDIKKGASVFSCKFGKNRRNSAEFCYDPLSYALNFEDDASRIDDYPLCNFSARLPQSPPSSEKINSVNIVVSREIAVWS